MLDRLDAVTDHFSTTPLARSTMFSSRALPKTICVFRQWATRLWARPGSAPWARAAAGAIAKIHKVTTSHQVRWLARPARRTAWQERLCPLTEDWRVRNKATA